MAEPVDRRPGDEQAIPGDEAEVERWAEAIADEAPLPRPHRPEDSASPLYRRMAAIAEAAAAFRGTFGEEGPDSPEALFQWGPLHVRRLLGEGSFGQVFAAWDPRLRREVALKLRREDAPGSSRRWLEEARTLAAVRHPNVLTVHGADEHEGRMGLWTDLVEGSDLETTLERRGPFSAREAASIGLELSAALAAVHAKGLVHGDVKTKNVMRQGGGDAPGRIVLMDFGSAHDAALALTAGRASSIGTPLAMAPEVLRGEPATAASDIYSLGALLFRLVTGRYPVEASTLDELRAKHDRRDRLSLRSLQPGLPREFIRVIEAALEPDPRRRTANAADLERALHDALPTASRGLTTRARWAIATAILVGIVVAIPWFTSRRTTAPIPFRTSPEATSPGITREPGGRPADAVGAGTAAAGGPATSVPRPPALHAEATFYRLRAGEATPLTTGGEIEPGDRMYVDVEAGEPIHAYVFDEDGTGSVVVLFPCAGTERRNPLEAGTPHRLPGGASHRELHWLVTSAEGRETFLIVLSREPLPSLDRIAAALPEASEAAGLQYAKLADEDLRRLRGVTGMVRDPVPVPAADPGRLQALARALGARDDAGNLWIRAIQVENPRH